jgi:hypothetical protein
MKGPNYFKPDFLKYWANNKQFGRLILGVLRFDKACIIS